MTKPVKNPKTKIHIMSDGLDTDGVLFCMSCGKSQEDIDEEESKTPLADKAIKELQQGYTEEESK